ncbi:hypothetical protein SAMN05446037_10575 [Anaerovirgula multivorans]|uniref:Homeodomain-like domain-containing protein n=1 Tax=Anaerovirgula multivorans TaxID=312168 RepID=A0A239KYA2_9FIRM|nr:sigma-70 family RNA polymerase sigma factor [Anaerovirgula multivorans]SNT22732.1 hypothetical protein SAMN05446037_10575 [Anaerovirgula multivorans]
MNHRKVNVEEITKQECVRILKRIAWKLQYSSKKTYKKECPLIQEAIGRELDVDTVLFNIYLEEILESIPSNKGRYIIKHTIIDGYSEKEVARQLNITQQGVNKWKKKYVNQLRQQMKHLDY